MPGQFKQEEIDKAMFMSLVMMLNSSAMQQLGKLVNPATGKTDVNLEGAQMSIDLLTMLQAKTKGNLDKEEERMLSTAVSSLQMNYFETSNDPKLKEAAKAEPAAEKPAEPAPEADPKAPKPDDKDPKYHKSYG